MSPYYNNYIIPVCSRADSDIGHSDWSILVPPSANREPIAGRTLSIPRQFNGRPFLHRGVIGGLSSVGGVKGYLEVYDIAGVLQKSVDFVVCETLSGCTIDTKNMVTKLESSTPDKVDWEEERERGEREY
jgi:hypothetical protein